MAHSLSAVLKSMTAAGVLLLLVGCGSAEDRAKSYYQSGMEYLDKKDYTKAAIEFRNALKLNENYADAWMGMALLEQQAQNWQRAYSDLKKVVELDPKNVKGLVGMATIETMANDTAAALKSIDAAAAIEPDNPDIKASRASILFKKGEKKAAVEEAQAALKLKPGHPDATQVIAADLLDKGQIEAALAMLDKVIAENPKNLALYMMKLQVLNKVKDENIQEAGARQLVEAFPEEKLFHDLFIKYLVNRGKKDEAEKVIRDSLAVHPDDIGLGLELVGFLMAYRSPASARDELLKFIAAGTQPFKYQMALAELDIANNRQSEAEDMLRGLVKDLGISENGIAARLKLSSYLLSAKRYSEAQTLVDEVLKNDTQNLDGLTQRAMLSIESGKIDDGINDLRSVINLDPKNVNAHLMLASAYERNGQMELAAKEFSDAVDVGNHSAKPGLAYVSFLQRHGNVDRAEEILRDLETREPLNPDVLAPLSNILAQKGNWKGAEDVARQLASLPDGKATNLPLGTSLMGQKKYDDAIEAFKKAVAERSADQQSLTALVGAYVAAGRLSEADAFLSSAQQASPQNATIIAMRGVVQFKNNQPDLAKASFAAAIARDPTAPFGYESMADLLASQNNAAEAEKVLNDGIKNVKDNASLRLSLAGRLELDGRFEDAIAQYELMMATKSNSLVVVNNLASLLTDHRTDKQSLDRAAALAQVLRNSPVPQFRETLGWSLVTSGNTRDGLSLLERTIAELEGLPVAQYHLGVAYAKSGQKELAAKHLNIALGLEKSADAQEKIKKALSELQTQTSP